MVTGTVGLRMLYVPVVFKKTDVCTRRHNSHLEVRHPHLQR